MGINIASDTQSSGVDLAITTVVKTIPYTVTGDNTSIFVAVLTPIGANYDLSSVTYGGDYLRLAQSISGTMRMTFHYKLNCKEGTNDLVLTFVPPNEGSAYWAIASYSGTQNTVANTTSYNAETSASTLSTNISPTVDNTWLIGAAYTAQSITDVTAGYTIRTTYGDILSIIDSNGSIGKNDTYPFEVTQGTAGHLYLSVAAIEPVFTPRNIII